eukprot:TRINITY_DN7536_c0_g1_i2.p3 TRINITY_DN7536_c0_g1~~TRINITY_DN7536_c0_g1_i2.p3  ORF type:complete len:134 (+),score=34.37 TRINITY_DN7536_c0_g1_i2:143-544(+)
MADFDDERGQHMQRYDDENELLDDDGEDDFNEEEAQENEQAAEDKFELVDKKVDSTKKKATERITPKFMTKYEKARIIGTRALQISKNAPIMVQFGKDDYDPIQIAEKELTEKKIPFIVRRYLPDGSLSLIHI